MTTIIRAWSPGDPLPRGMVVLDPDQLQTAKEAAMENDDPFCPGCGYAIDAHLVVETPDGPIRETCPSEAEAR